MRPVATTSPWRLSGKLYEYPGVCRFHSRGNLVRTTFPKGAVFLNMRDRFTVGFSAGIVAGVAMMFTDLSASALNLTKLLYLDCQELI